MNIRYIIVDDEPIAHRVIEKYCEDLSFMQLEVNGQMQDESAPVSLSLFFVVLLIRKGFS